MRTRTLFGFSHAISNPRSKGMGRRLKPSLVDDGACVLFSRTKLSFSLLAFVRIVRQLRRERRSRSRCTFVGNLWCRGSRGVSSYSAPTLLRRVLQVAANSSQVIT